MIVTLLSDKLTEFGIENYKLEIFEVDTALLEVVQWQPNSIIEFSRTSGFIPSNPSHKQNALLFIQHAVSSNAALAITPEYCFPYDTLELLISDESLWPSPKKLWCLGMEGINNRAFSEFVDRINDKKVIWLEPHINSKRRFLDALFYLMVIDNKLCIVCQAKYQPARDRFGDLEGINMSLGDEIIAFTDVTQTKVFFSFICSDALTADIDILNQKFRNAKMIVFIPQLNPSFVHESFDFAYYRFLYHRANVRIIVANWSNGTAIQTENISYSIIHGFSSFLKPFQITRQNQELHNKNHFKGLYYGYKDHAEIWHFTNKEFIMTYSILPYQYENTHMVLQENVEPYVISIFTIDSNRLIPEEHFCNIDWEWLENSLLINREGFCALNRSVSICNCFRNLYLFVSSFFIETYSFGNYSMKDQLISPVFKLNNYPENSKHIHAARMQRSYIESMLYSIDNRSLPDHFQHFKNNHKWILNKELINISVINQKQFCHKHALVVYADSLDAARSFFNRFSASSQYGDDYANTLIIYYVSPDGYCCYEPEERNSEIYSPQLSDMSII